MQGFIRLNPGATVGHEGKNWRYVGAVDMERAVIEDRITGAKKTVRIERLEPTIVDPPQDDRTKSDAIASDADWEHARRLYDYIKPLLDANTRTKARVQKRARQVHLSAATLYRCIALYENEGRLSALLPRRSSGGRGKSRLSPRQDHVIQESIENGYLTRERPTMKAIAMEVARNCGLLGIDAPHANTVRNRIRSLNAAIVLRKRHGPKAASKSAPHPGTFDEATFPLAIVEIDHTPLDIILVDDLNREKIGRPWLTMAIDVYSRMVTGYYVSLDPIGNLSTGLCIAHSILRKEGWLEKHGIQGPWPCWGVMQCIYSDNAKEFRGRMLRRACEEYGIDLQWRPVARPHFGAHIERALGTVLKQTHQLPGTTFSNVPDKGEYDSEGNACFTFAELETWLANWFVNIYHRAFHRTINTSPLQKYESWFTGPNAHPLPAIVADEKKLRLDFMPFEERTIQPTGVVLDGVHYYHDVLRNWIGARGSGGTRNRKFIFKRDPRDISTIYFFDPDNNEYREIPYAGRTHDSISLWELRAARRKLYEEGKRHIDEAALFEETYRNRERAREAAERTKAARSARRSLQRLSNQRRLRTTTNEELATPVHKVMRDSTFPPATDDGPIHPFSDLEKL
jgi:putative transposase